MAIVVRENHEKRALAIPVVLVCQFRVDQELVLRCQERADPDHKMWRGQPLGTLSDIWPWSDMKDTVKREAQEFVGYMKQQDYQPIGAYTEMELWGPYMQKVDWGKARNADARESDGHTYPQGYLHDANIADYRLGVVFHIRGNFLAKYGKMVEEVDEELLVI